MFLTARRRIASFALVSRLPTVYTSREHVEDGGLISYGVDLHQNYRRAAYFVDKILKGEKPGDLPIEFPTKVELVVNATTAKAIGVTIPPTLLARAASGQAAAAPPSATSNSRRPMVVIRASRARCEKANDTTPRACCPNSAAPGAGGARIKLNLRFS